MVLGQQDISVGWNETWTYLTPETNMWFKQKSLNNKTSRR